MKLKTNKLNKITDKIRTWENSLLKGQQHHFSYFLPGKKGFTASWMLRLFYRGITVGSDQIAVLDKIPEDAIVVYVTKYKSHFKYLFYHTRYQQLGCRFPEIGMGYEVFLWQPISRIFRISLFYLDHILRHFSFPDPYKSGYMRNELLAGRTALLSLVSPRGFYRRFVKSEAGPIEYLVEMQKSIDRPIFLIPQLMFFSKKPSRPIPGIIDILFGSEQKPGVLRRLVMLLKNPGKIFIEISEPLNLMTFIQQQAKHNLGNEHLCLMVRRNLLRQLNRHRQSITGPQLKSIEEMKESILTRDRLSRYMRQHAKSKNISIQKTRKQADAYLKEIAARYSTNMIKVFSAFLTWMFKIMFDGFTVNQKGLSRVKSMSQKGPLILLPCHKSHIDYLLLSYIMNQNNMPCPLVAAGKNLSFWPLGPIFRKSGAFFLRRTFKGMPLYSIVFSEYIYKILEEGFNLELFVEGGRSRTGKLLMPKLGMLSILIEAYKNGACEDLIFVPVFVGYDRVLEESAYLHELEGGKKNPESFSRMINARKFLKKKYGRIYVNFDKPFTLTEFLRQNNFDLAGDSTGQHKKICRIIGHKVLNAIDRTTVVTPHALVAGAILNFSKNRFSYDRILAQVETYIHYLHQQDVMLSDTLILDHGYALEQVIDAYVQRKFILPISGEKSKPYTDAQFQVNIAKRPVLDYYKNNCIAFFVPAAFTALGILGKNAFQFTASDLHAPYALLQNFFRFEFTYNADLSADFIVRKSLKAFINDAILMPHATLPDTYNLTAEGFEKLKNYARFLKTYFESYQIVLQYLKESSEKNSGTKESLKKIQSFGNRMYKKQEIELKEALSKANYRNAIALFKSKTKSGHAPDQRLKFFTQTIEHYRDYLTQ